MYKTMVLELIEQEYPALHERLRSTRTLLSTMDRYALELKSSHEAWMDRLSQTRPGSDPSQIASQALELATEDLRAGLCSSSPPDEAPAESLSLDAAMAFIRRSTPIG